MCRGKELNEGQKGGIITAKILGHTNTDISKVIGCSHSSVWRVWESYQLGNPSEKRIGRSRILNESERKHLKHFVVRNKKTRRQTLSQIRLNVMNKTNKNISNQTIHNELARQSLHSRIPYFSPLIFERNKERCLLWARTYKN